MLGSGQTKDNFFLQTRQAIQDTIGLFFVTRNISFNNSLEFYLPRMVEMVSDLLDVERCSIFLYDGVKDTLFCKVITGRLREPVNFPRSSDNVLCKVFNSGSARHFKKAMDPAVQADLGEYIQMNQKLHQVIRNVLLVPIKLGSHAIGVFEIANKKSNQDFTSNDFTLLSQLADELAGGLISHEMKYNIKRELEEEVRYHKGLANQSYHQFLIPMVSDLTASARDLLKAQKAVLFVLNKDIDHLYSLATDGDTSAQQAGQFSVNSIRMKSNLGLAGKAYSSG